MNILLINSNPVVSRLVSLCMREDNVVFEEVESVGNVLLDRYAFVFVDDASYGDETKDILSNLIIRKKVFLSSRDEGEDALSFFDFIIKKPFLPSQINAVLKSMDERESVEVTVQAPSIFPLASEDETVEDNDEAIQENLGEDAEVIAVTEVLDSNEIEKIKALLEMDDEKSSQEEFDEDYEIRKVEAIKQQLEADGLEIVNEEEYVEELSKKPKYLKNKKIKKEKKKYSEFSKKELKSIKDAMQISINKIKPKKIKKLLKGKKVKVKVKLEDIK